MNGPTHRTPRPVQAGSYTAGMPAPRVLVILGPTAGGKSALAVSLCERLPAVTGHAGEVVGADSMQVYRHLDAGTAKPTPDERRRVPHHLIDLVEPTERFTVRDWLDHADAAIADIQRRGKHPVVVGGTNLYLKALLEGLMEGPDHDADFRATLADFTPPQLHEKLKAVDPTGAERIQPNDRQRLTRALEVFHLTGRPISELQTQWTDGGWRMADGGWAERNAGIKETSDTPEDASTPSRSKPPFLHPPSAIHHPPSPGYRHDPVLIGLRWPVEAINPRINLRVKAMFTPGSVEPELAEAVCIGGESLPDEVCRLDDAGLLGPQAREALGYKQTLAALRPEKHPDLADARIRSLDDAMERTKVLTRRFAKQQRTWLKRFRGVHWIDMPCDDPAAQALTLAASTP